MISRDYDDPDPTINPTEAENDLVWWTRGALVLPVAETWALVPQVEYRDQNSNYDIRAFDDLTGAGRGPEEVLRDDGGIVTEA